MPCCRAGKGRRASCLGEARAGPHLAWNRPLHCLYHNHTLVMLLTRLQPTYSCWRSHYISRSASTLPRPPPLVSLTSQEDMRVARGWIAAYEQTRAEDFPRGESPDSLAAENIRSTPLRRTLSFPPSASSCSLPDALEISYSRSSGPGGQNVNKLSTKATLRLPLSSATSLFPPYTLTALRSSPYYVSSPPPSILLSSSSHRTQPQNLHECLAKLKRVVLEAAQVGLVGETSEEQRRRVVALVGREKRRTEQIKKQRKDVKSGRRAGKGGWD